MTAPQDSIPAIKAPPPTRDNPLTRSLAGMIGLAFLAVMLAASLFSIPWTFSAGSIPWYPAADPSSEQTPEQQVRRYNAGLTSAARLPPFWVAPGRDSILRLHALVPETHVADLAARHNLSPHDLLTSVEGEPALALRAHWPRFPIGTDSLGRDLFIRCLAGGSVSLTIGLLAALLSVTIGTLYGAVAGYVGGTLDAVMMRIVDILYGLPYILLVVLLAVAADSIITDRVASWSEQAQVRRDAWIQDEATRFLAAGGRLVSPQDLAAELASNETLRVRLEREGEQRFPARTLTEMQRAVLDLGTLLLAIGGVSWLTMARVIRGQVLSLKARPFMEAARAMGVPVHRLFLRHLLPNLLGPIIVYTTLTVPQAILQESFLSFLGIGVRPPIPSWGNLAADGLSELNRHKSHWWMLFFPCILLGATLLSLNFVGEGLREAFDPRRARR